MTTFFLFILGAAFGSFLNVVALRYKPDKFLLSQRTTGGRSKCPHCKKVLRWFELIPLASFILQKGRCRNCHKKIGVQYPLAEIISGLIFVLVPWRLASYFYILHSTFYIPVFLWLLVFSTLLLVSLVDFRLSIIPDEASLFLAALGAVIVLFSSRFFGPADGSFFGGGAAFFGLRQNIWLNHIAAALLAAAFFFALIVLTKGKGMGIGDLKLAGALGLVFGWPDILFIVLASFVIGAAVGIALIAASEKNLKSAIPFGPFLGAAALVLFLFGRPLMDLYLGSIGVF